MYGAGEENGMQCAKCGKELDDAVRFCPFCGEKVERGEAAPAAGTAGNEAPLYQADVKGLLKSGRLTVYSDRTEFVVSAVQKIVIPYDRLVTLKKGLDRINFVMDDGRTESCAVNRRNLHEAYFHIEQASKNFIAQRNRRLESEGIMFSFPSSRFGISGMLNSGLLNVMADRTEFTTPSGKSETVSYEDVKSVRISAVGALEFSLYDGTRKAFTADKELREKVAGFIAEALKPFIEARRQRLLEQGIYFSFLDLSGSGKGVLNIYADRLEYDVQTGQNDVVAFQDILSVGGQDTTLETALTNGTTKTFYVDREAQSEVLAFLNEAIAPFVRARTEGFDACFGLHEKLEINESRGVFHVIRQGGRQITQEYALASLAKAEAVETKTSQNIVGSLFASKNQDAAVKSTDDRITDIGVLLTVQNGDRMGNVPISFGSFFFGVARTSADYEKCVAERTRFFSYMEENHPDCQLILPAPVEEEEVPAAPAEESAAVPAADESGTVAAAEDESGAAAAAEDGQQAVNEPSEGTRKNTSGSERKGQYGTLIDGIARFAGQCDTPMTIAIQGDGEAVGGGFIRMLQDGLEENFHGNIFRLYTWQFSKFDEAEQLPMILADKLMELLNGTVNEETKARAKMLAQGMIGIASGMLSQGSSDGQKLADAIFRDNRANSLEQKVRLFTETVKRRAAGGSGKVIFLVDDLNRLAPAKAAEILDAMRYFFDCPGCIFMVAVDRETLIRGRRELQGEQFTDEKGDAYFDKTFRMAFRVTGGNVDIHRYIKDYLGRVNISTDDEAEARHYGELARLSVGSSPKVLERLFNSFLLLKSYGGEEAFADGSMRLALFALLCMQNRFPAAYHSLVRMKDQLTPEILEGLPFGPVMEEQAGTDRSEGEAFASFAKEFCSSINTDGKTGITDQECAAFAQALAISAITSMK